MPDAAAELHRHRVDEERHVVGDDLDDGVRRLPAVLLELRVVDADLGRARLALAPSEAPVRSAPPTLQVRKRGAVQVEQVNSARSSGGTQR